MTFKLFKTMDIIRQLVRKIINEVMGVSSPVDEMAEWLAGFFYKNLYFYNENGQLKNNMLYTFVFTPPDNIKTNFPVNAFHISVAITKSDEIKVDGSFKTDKTKHYIVGNRIEFDAYLELKLSWDFENNITQIIFQYLSHELSHIYKHIKIHEKKAKSAAYNSAYKLASLGVLDLIDKNPAIKEFLHVFYLALPEEVNARVQEAYAEIKKHKGKTPQEIIDILYKTKAMSDAKTMLNYKSNNLLSLQKDILYRLMEALSNQINIELSSNELTTGFLNYPKEDINPFFEHWRKKINSEGNNLFRKITKTISLITENDEINMLFYKIDADLLEEIFGYDIHTTNIFERIDYL